MFLCYLGVNIPSHTEQQLVDPSTPTADPSLKIIEAIWARLLSAARARGVEVPLRIIAETVSRHNADAIVKLVQTLRTGLAELSLPPVAGATRAPG